jgi:hypothetical protein
MKHEGDAASVSGAIEIGLLAVTSRTAQDRIETLAIERTRPS